MTILFMEDWHKASLELGGMVPKIHYETKNKSFIRLANVYHSMGIKNCAFHLALYDQDLKDIDPHNPLLTTEYHLKITRECISNFWYYLREVCKVNGPGSMDGIPFKINRSNSAMYFMFFANVMQITVKMRQSGKTTAIVALLAYLLNFGYIGTAIGLLTKDDSLRADTLKALKEQFSYLPDYLNFSTKKDTFNNEQVILNQLGNSLHSFLSNASPKEADKVGRGFTLTSIFVDEVAFINNVDRALSALSMSGNAAMTVAADKSKNDDGTDKVIGRSPYGMMLTTTAGDLATKSGSHIHQMIQSSTNYNEAFLDANDRKDLLTLIFKNSSARSNSSKKPIVYISMSYKQLGFTDAWMKGRIENSGSSDTNISKDLFNVWVSGTSSSPLSELDKKNLLDGVVEDPRSDFFNPYGYLIKWFITEEELTKLENEGASFIAGVDTSDAIGSDDIAFTVRESVSGSIVCSAIFNEINLYTLSNFFCDFLIKHPKVVMIMERRSSAATIIDTMLVTLAAKGINIFDRMYNTIYQNKDKYEEEFKEIKRCSCNIDVLNKYRAHIGFKTSGSGITSRTELFSSTMSSMLKYTASLIRDRSIVDQYLTLIVKNGRIDHSQGNHDDLVVSTLLSYFFIMSAKNLGAYGVNTSFLMKKNTVYLQDKYRTDEAKNEMEEQSANESVIAMLIDRLKGETNEIIEEQISRHILYLSKDVSLTNDAITYSELVQNIRKEKDLNRRKRAA